MCGIAGQVRLGEIADARTVESMCAALEHRGPDSRGIHSGGEAALGIQRLRIIDLVTGDQPIRNEDGSVAVVLNGEIYNFAELRSELEGRGHRFSTESDTEVIVHLYEEHGPRCVERLIGMFAFALWDDRHRRLVLARDRAGKKPLFLRISEDGRRLSFASELPALMRDPSVPRDIDPQALDAFLALRYVPAPLSAYRAVRKLPPATVATFDDSGFATERYWQLDFAAKRTEDEGALHEELRERLRTAVRRRMIADVPLGAFLSGGIDSAAVVAAMSETSAAPVKTFSIGFDDPRLDERDLARITADRFATDHTELVVEPNAVEIIPKILRHHGEPFADATSIPTFYLAELARRDVTVALNGDGGDEIFAGYRRYAANRIAGRLDGLPDVVGRGIGVLSGLIPESPRVDSARSRVRRLGSTMAMGPFERHLAYMTTLQGFDRRAVYTREFANEVDESRLLALARASWDADPADDPLDRMLAFDTRTFLPDDLLAKVDIATMAVSLEARSPLLDHELMEFAAALPARLKLRGTETKAVFRRALRGWIPDAVLDAPKRGFQPPLALWFRGELKQMAGEVLLDRRARDRGYFDPRAIEELLARHSAGQADNSQAIWTLMMFELWHQEYADRPLGAQSGARVAKGD